jgi:hypothetical protein
VKRSLTLSAVVFLASAASAPAQILVPSGFTVAKTINVGQTVSGLAIAPGGAFGSDLYATDVNGEVLKVNTTAGTFAPFATGLPTGISGPSGLAFDNGAFGTGNLYASLNNGSVVVVNSAGAVSPFSSGNTLFSSNDLEFGPQGSAFAGKLFVSNGDFSGGNVSQVNSAGVNSNFAPTGFGGATPIGIAFAPTGSAFGGNLYASVDNGSVAQINSGGTVSTFATGTGIGDDLAFGKAAFGDNIYVTNSASEVIDKVTPGGAVSTWATGLSLSGSAFDGDLVFSADGNTLFLANNTQIVVITANAVPEPGPLVLAATGLLLWYGSARLRRRGFDRQS